MKLFLPIGGKHTVAYIRICWYWTMQAHIYSCERVDTSRSLSESTNICSAFLANIDEHKSATVKIFGKVYSLPPWSVSILPDCKNVAFNTAKVRLLSRTTDWQFI